MPLEEHCQYYYEYAVLEPFLGANIDNTAIDSLANNMTELLINKGYNEECLEEKSDSYRNCVLNEIKNFQIEYELDRISKNYEQAKRYYCEGIFIIKMFDTFLVALSNSPSFEGFDFTNIAILVLGKFVAIAQNEYKSILEEDYRVELECNGKIRKYDLRVNLHECALKYWPTINSREGEIQKFYSTAIEFGNRKLDKID